MSAIAAKKSPPVLSITSALGPCAVIEIDSVSHTAEDRRPRPRGLLSELYSLRERSELPAREFLIIEGHLKTGDLAKLYAREPLSLAFKNMPAAMEDGTIGGCWMTELEMLPQGRCRLRFMLTDGGAA